MNIVTSDGSVAEPLELAEQDIPALSAFLIDIFQKPADTPAFQPEYLRWKYLVHRSDWSLPRSLLYKNDQGEVVAHAGAWPVQFKLANTIATTVMVIDWARSAAPEHGGLGTRLLDPINRGASLKFGVGGTPVAQRKIIQLGYVQSGSFDTHWRVVRPWKNLVHTAEPLRSWHVGNLLRGLASNIHAWWTSRDWNFEPIESFAVLEHALAARGPDTWTCGVRTVAMLDYMLACPADCKAFVLRRKQAICGYILFSRRERQVRIADLWINSSLAEDWHGAFATAIRAARAYPDAELMTAICSVDPLRDALQSNGFRASIHRPIWLLDPAGQLDGAPALQIQALEADSWFL